MGSTAKILFGSFLAICIVGMFLLFSMQKSAQLTLDKDAMQLVANEKDNKIESINDALTAAKATVEKVATQNKRIPKLKAQLDTTEKEKLVYVQQLDDFQAELQNQVDIAEQRLGNIRTLQEQQNSDQQTLANTNEALATAELQNNELATALETTLHDIEDKALNLQQLTDILIQKDRVIQIYKEKLDRASDDIQLLQTADSNEQLNLKLILDDLAVKTALVNDLGKKLEQTAMDAMVSGTNGNTHVSTANEDQILIEKLSLENDFLGTGIKEQNKIIKELELNIAAANQLLASFDTEIEQLQFLVTEKDKEQKALQLKAEGTDQELKQLAATLNARADEIAAVKEQTMGIAAPLTEKITSLELQITQAANQYTTLAEELSEAQSALLATQGEKQLISDELSSTQVALETNQNILSESVYKQTAMEETLNGLEQQLSSTNEVQVALATELENTTLLTSEKETAIEKLSSQLEAAKKENIALETEQDERISRLIDEVAAAKVVSAELAEKTANLQERNEELLAALAAREEVPIPEATLETEVIEPEEVVVPEVTLETEVIEPEEVVVPETSSDPEDAGEAVGEVEPEQLEVIAIETESAPQDVETVVEAEEPTAEDTATENVSDDSVQDATNPVMEEIPLQEDSANEENM